MKKIIAIIIVISILVGVGYILSQKRIGTKAHDMTNMEGKKVVQSHRSYSFKLVSSEDNLKPGQETNLKYKIVDENGNVLKDFEINHTKLMHFIIIRSDLQDFQHIHPKFDKGTGEFSIPVTFPENGKYRLFADFTPASGQKDSEGNYLPVTPFKDINVGDVRKIAPVEIIPGSQTTQNIGDYKISYSFAQEIKSGDAVELNVDVFKNGEPVTDMEEYLGAQAHGILLKKDSLDFAHLHAVGLGTKHVMSGEKMTMEGSIRKGPEIKFDYTFPESGVYKLFTQFQHLGKVITSERVIQVE